ncbi:MAG: hypothetical protein IKM74_04225, partial [Bacteroidales bacterium]|nr:hypothetical protein [Bacteroidales bacterium]
VVLFLFPVLGLRYDSLFLTGGPRLLGGPARLLASYAGLKLSKNSRPPLSSSPLPCGRKRLQRYNLFSFPQAFFHFFFQKFFSPLIISIL